MRISIVFAAGILVGVGATQLAHHFAAPLPPSSPVAVVAPAAPAAVPTPAPIPLETRIAALRDWSTGHAPTLSQKTAFDHLRAWSQSDPYAALDFILHAPRLPDRLQAAAFALSLIARDNTPFVTRWLKENLTTSERGNTAEEIIRTLIDPKNPPVCPVPALELAFENNIPVDRSTFASILGVLITQDVKATMAGFARLSTEGKARAASAIVHSWVKTDPTAARHWCEQLRGEPYFENTVGTLVHAVAYSHPAQLTELLQRFPETAESLSPYTIISLFKKEPELATALLQKMPLAARTEFFDHGAYHLELSPEKKIQLAHTLIPESADDLAQAIGSIFNYWTRSDGIAARAWLAAQPDSPLYAVARAAEANRLARENPVAALNSLVTQNPTQALKATATAALDSWSNLEPVSAAHWLSAHPTWIDNSTTIQEVTWVYLNKDEPAAATWLATLPTGSLRDTATARAAEYWADHKERTFAIQAATSITDPAQRLRTLSAVISTLNEQAPTQTEQLIAKLPITDAEKQVLRIAFPTPSKTNTP